MQRVQFVYYFFYCNFDKYNSFNHKHDDFQMVKNVFTYKCYGKINFQIIL